jgi:hypothetical protein
MPLALLSRIVLFVSVTVPPAPPAVPMPPSPPVPPEPSAPGVPAVPALPEPPLASIPSLLLPVIVLLVNVIVPPPCSVMPFWPWVTVTSLSDRLLGLPGASLIVMTSNVLVWPSRIRPLPSSVMLTPAATSSELFRSSVQLAGKLKVALPLVMPARSMGKLLAWSQLD